MKYTPLDWNPYPEATPPEGVMMRLLVLVPGEEPVRLCATWTGYGWESNGELLYGADISGLYRPWDTEDELFLFGKDFTAIPQKTLRRIEKFLEDKAVMMIHANPHEQDYIKGLLMDVRMALPAAKGDGNG